MASPNGFKTFGESPGVNSLKLAFVRKRKFATTILKDLTSFPFIQPKETPAWWVHKIVTTHHTYVVYFGLQNQLNLVDVQGKTLPPDLGPQLREQKVSEVIDIVTDVFVANVRVRKGSLRDHD